MPSATVYPRGAPKKENYKEGFRCGDKRYALEYDLDLLYK